MSPENVVSQNTPTGWDLLSRARFGRVFKLKRLQQCAGFPEKLGYEPEGHTLLFHTYWEYIKSHLSLQTQKVETSSLNLKSHTVAVLMNRYFDLTPQLSTFNTIRGTLDCFH